LVNPVVEEAERCFVRGQSEFVQQSNDTGEGRRGAGGTANRLCGTVDNNLEPDSSSGNVRSTSAFGVKVVCAWQFCCAEVVADCSGLVVLDLEEF